MIVAVCGGKGGVGKTTVALNIGAVANALIVDADLGMADLPTTSGPDLHDVLAGRVTPKTAVRQVGPLRLLPCGRSLTGARAADPTRLDEVLEQLEQRYKRVVVDCPAGMAADVGLPLYTADRSVLVTTPDRVAIPDAIRTRALARTFDARVIRLVVNTVQDNPPLETIRQTLGIPPIAVPADDQVARAVDTGIPVQQIAPDSTPAQRFTQVAQAAFAPRPAEQ